MEAQTWYKMAWAGSAKTRDWHLIEVVIVLDPSKGVGGLPGRWDHGNVVTGNVVMGNSWEESCGKLFALVDKCRKEGHTWNKDLKGEYPNATLYSAGLLWPDRKEYAAIKACVGAMIHSRFPEAKVDIADDYG